MFSSNLSKSAQLGLALLACVIVSCNSKSDVGATANAGAMPAMPVKIKVAEPTSIPDYSEYVATLQSRSASILQPDEQGLLTRVLVKSGDSVKVGDPLFQIDPVRQEATINTQESNRKAKQAVLDLTKQALERSKGLYAAGVVAKQDLDQAQSAYDAAVGDLNSVDANVSEQKVQLRYYTVLAPTAGIIGDIPVRVGDHVSLTSTLTTIDTGKELEAYINVPAEKAKQAREDLPVILLGPDGKPELYTKLTYISPRIDPTNQLLLVKADIENTQKRYKNQEQVRVQVQWTSHPQATIPVLCVTRLGGQFFAFIAEPDKDGKGFVARQRALQVGEINGNDYVVLDGIKAGDRIIISGVQLLQDGAPVVPQA